MTNKERQLKILLDSIYEQYNTPKSISTTSPDPLLEVYKHKTCSNFPYIALICALFSYGNVGAIMKFLNTLPWEVLDSKEEILKYHFPYYRFQNSEDVRQIFLAVYAFKSRINFTDFIATHYRGDMLCLIDKCMQNLYDSILYKSRGLEFLIGKPHSYSPRKRWNMFMRWMVRKDNIDLGIWSHLIKPKDLLLPLDTHTFKVCQAIGLLQSKSYNIKAVLEVSQKLKKFDYIDPIKYDFALYRIGQNETYKTWQKKYSIMSKINFIEVE